jgi:iron complex transport system ATP-binding protein
VVAAARFRLGGSDGKDAGAGQEFVDTCLADMDCLPLAGRDVRRLSRGERQRIALAAGLAQDAPLLLLDEPLSHQDPRHQMQVLERLARKSHCTCIAAMHNISAAANFATHALLLSGDGAWFAGPIDAMLTAVMLKRIFGTEIAKIETGKHRVFVSASGAPV